MRQFAHWGFSSYPRSYQFQPNPNHSRIGALISIASLRRAAYGVFAGVVLRVVVEGLVHVAASTHWHRPIASVANIILLQLSDRVMAGGGLLSVVLRNLRFLVIASVSVTSVCVTTYLVRVSRRRNVPAHEVAAS